MNATPPAAIPSLSAELLPTGEVPDDGGSTRKAGWIGAIYFVFGALWILLSDAVIHAASADEQWRHAAQTYKGLVYIIVTTLGLVLLVRLGYRRQAAAHRLALQTELREQDLFMNHPKPMWAFDRETLRFLRVNAAAIAHYGYSRDEFLRMTVLDIRPPEDVPLALAAVAIDPQGQNAAGIFRHRKKSGELIQARVLRQRLVVDGRPASLVMAEDVTEQMALDQAMRLQEAQFKASLEQQVAQRTQQLEQANLELDAFSRTAAHDLKTPLNGVAGLARLLRSRHGAVLDEKGLHYVDQIERSARDMAALINDLLALSRAGSAPLQPAPVDLLPVAQEVVDELRRAEPGRDMQVLLPARMPAWCDPGLMRSVLQNLIGNAWKFTAGREPGRITVTLDEADGRTHLRVSDNGAGFDSRSLPTRYLPFQRYHPQAQFQGTGVGLVTCQRIAHRHGGELALQSKPGVGTTADFSLPLRPLPEPVQPA